MGVSEARDKELVDGRDATFVITITNRFLALCRDPHSNSNSHSHPHNSELIK